MGAQICFHDIHVDGLGKRQLSPLLQHFVAVSSPNQILQRNDDVTRLQVKRRMTALRIHDVHRDHPTARRTLRIHNIAQSRNLKQMRPDASVRSHAVFQRVQNLFSIVLAQYNLIPEGGAWSEYLPAIFRPAETQRE